MTTFDRALAHLFIMEGGYVNDPHDPGGETNFGISKRYHPHEDIKRMTRERAGEIYREEYWEPLSCGDMPYFIALAVFDSGVLDGIADAARMLQIQLNFMVRGENRLAEDGAIGPKTLGRLNSHPHQKDVLHRFMAHRAIMYAEDPNGERYEKGWVTRLFHVHGAALE